MNKRNFATTVALITALVVMLQGQAIAQQTSAGMAAVQEAEQHRANLRGAEAEAAYQRALQLSPNDPNVLAAYASFVRQMGDDERSIQLLLRAEESNSSDDDARTEIRNQLARTYLSAGNYNAAALLFQQEVASDPTFPIARINLGQIEVLRGNREAALRHTQVAEQLFGDNLGDYRSAQIAMNYAHLGQRDDVLRLYNHIQSLDDVADAAWAGIYIALGDYGQALEYLQAAVDNPVPRIRGLLTYLARNEFGDPALENSQFQELFAQLRPR